MKEGQQAQFAARLARIEAGGANTFVMPHAGLRKAARPGMAGARRPTLAAGMMAGLASGLLRTAAAGLCLIVYLRYAGL
ncbi:hypothetical protein [Celeribacter indicus]|uniref:Uncharacterized protein n=1 Tax=Celeribacter indicus TaxID=1208324 RepID=A0A0B5E0X8_9RHOB|nr:hypothetical protein [Celeribacter indicus]AJE47070.1 hypothetical protein P73_2355 [Celeribacter indicus]SDW91683.1 hypothetical protein SAMN05443573_10981 [Celeribacter indicus]